MTKIISPGHVSVGGQLFEMDDDGVVDVPEEHVAHLCETHGCVRIDEDMPADKKSKKKRAASEE